jgi:hypothetical protein
MCEHKYLEILEKLRTTPKCHFCFLAFLKIGGGLRLSLDPTTWLFCLSQLPSSLFHKGPSQGHSLINTWHAELHLRVCIPRNPIFDISQRVMTLASARGNRDLTYSSAIMQRSEFLHETDLLSCRCWDSVTRIHKDQVYVTANMTQHLLLKACVKIWMREQINEDISEWINKWHRHANLFIVPRIEWIQ